METQYEYVITEDQRPELRSTLERLRVNLSQSDRDNNPFFEFEWYVGHLVVKTRSGSASGSSRSIGVYSDAPRYRVTAGTNSRVLRNFIKDYLHRPGQRLERVRSITWSGMEVYAGEKVFFVQRLEVCEGVPAVIDTTNGRCVSPLSEWDHTRVGGLMPLSARRLSRPIGSLGGYSHLTEDTTRFVITHLSYPNERLILYHFEGHPMLRVLDPGRRARKKLYSGKTAGELDTVEPATEGPDTVMRAMLFIFFLHLIVILAGIILSYSLSVLLFEANYK